MFSGECCCVWLMMWILVKDLRTLFVVLLEDWGNAGQYKQWDIPGGSAAILPLLLMICSTHYSVCL